MEIEAYKEERPKKKKKLAKQAAPRRGADPARIAANEARRIAKAKVARFLRTGFWVS